MRNLTFQGVEFRDTTIAPSGAYDVLKALKNPVSAIHFDDAREIYAMFGGAYVVAYGTAGERDTDAICFSSASRLDGRDPDTQIPEVCGSFEANGRFGLILQARRARSGITNAYAHDGIVVNPGKFAELVDSAMFAVICDTRGKVEHFTNPAA